MVRSEIRTVQFVVKPIQSQGQGEYVQRFNVFATDIDNLNEYFNHSGTNSALVQEFIDYLAIYRVIVINGKALPFVTMDTPTEDDWKVSVCLNPKQVPIKNPDSELLRMAERVQGVINGEINFVDIFKTITKQYVLSEVNTACNLSGHEEILNENIAKYIAEYLVKKERSL